MAMEMQSILMDNDETTDPKKDVANLLWDEIMQYRNCLFKGSFEDFPNPLLLQYYLTHSLSGQHVLKESGICNKNALQSKANHPLV